MPQTLPHAIAGRLIALAPLFCLVLAPWATADERKIDVVRNGVATTLVLPEYTSQGVPYASLADLSRQLGGRVEIDTARAAVILGEVRAEVGLNDVAVRREGESFSLLHPVLPYQSDALIAMSDVIRFLREGYGMGTPEDPPTASALILSAEEIPLESVVPDTPTPAVTPDPMEGAGLESVAPVLDALEDTPLESVTPLAAAPVAPIASGVTLVAIDPGHGGDDTGIVGASGLSEKDLCLAVATRLRRILSETYGLATVATREGDDSRSHQNRVDLLKSSRAGLILSLHAGASYATDARGPAFIAHATSGTPRTAISVAQTVANTIGPALSTNAPVHGVALGLFRDIRVPGVMIELGNLANPAEEERLADPQYQEQLAAALAMGINQALGRPEPGGTAQ